MKKWIFWGKVVHTTLFFTFDHIANYIKVMEQVYIYGFTTRWTNQRQTPTTC